MLRSAVGEREHTGGRVAEHAGRCGEPSVERILAIPAARS